MKEESLHLDLKMFLALGMKIADRVDHNAISLSVTLPKGRISFNLLAMPSSTLMFQRSILKRKLGPRDKATLGITSEPRKDKRLPCKS